MLATCGRCCSEMQRRRVAIFFPQGVLSPIWRFAMLNPPFLAIWKAEVGDEVAKFGDYKKRHVCLHRLALAIGNPGRAAYIAFLATGNQTQHIKIANAAADEIPALLALLVLRAPLRGLYHIMSMYIYISICILTSR